MKRKWIGLVALFSLFHAGQLAAQPPRELSGQVFHLGENGETVIEPGLIVTFKETGASDDANDKGIFRLPLPPAFQPEDSVTFMIDKPGWRIRYPLDGEAKVPRDLLREIVSVELLPVGSKLFWTHDRIEKFIRDASERSKQEGRQEAGTTSLDLGRAIQEWATKYGFSAQEVREEIDRWITEVEAAHEDDYKKGLAAFAKQQFDAAAERFQDSAEWRIRQLEETRKQQKKLEEKVERLQEEVVRDLRLQGDSHYYAQRFEQALASYEQALQYTSKEQSPQLWAATFNDIGLAHLTLGYVGEAAANSAHFASAVQAFRQALLVFTHEQRPQDWAAVQNNLGNALQEQARRSPGEGSAQLLLQAVQAYEQALLVFTRERLPLQWAATQDNLGNALRQLGARTEGEEGARLLERAVQAHQQALLSRPRDRVPQAWAVTQNNLGYALQEHAKRTESDEGAQLLEQALLAHHQALLVFTYEQFPRQWAATNNHLGSVLQAQGTRTEGEEGARLLMQAVQAYEQALRIRTREKLPEDWAITQYNLGIALGQQGQRTPGKEGDQLLEQAAQATRQASLVLTPAHFLWASARATEATALLALGRDEEADEVLSDALSKEPSNRQALLTLQALRNRKAQNLKRQGTLHSFTGNFLHALAAYEQALQLISKDQDPQLWAATLNDIGSAHRELGNPREAAEGSAHLAAAVDAYRQALTVYTREEQTQEWAETQNMLGLALRAQGARTEGDEGDQPLEQAVQAYREVLTVYNREKQPKEWADVQRSLGLTLWAQGERAPSHEGDQFFAQAVRAFRQALQVFTPDGASEEWAMTRVYEAEALLALHRHEEAAEALSQTLAKVPDHSQAFHLLGAILNDQLFRHQEAVTLTRSWLSRHPDDLSARLALGEQLFSTRAFSDCSQEISSLLKEQELDAESRIVALAYAIAASLATGSSDGPHQVEELLGVVAAQPQDFRTSWTFEGALHSLGEDPEVSHKNLLIRLFQTLEAPDRDSLLKGLKEWREAIPLRRNP